MRGGIFMYPYDSRDPSKPSKLRLMYEANPMSFIVELADGLCSTAHERIMDMPVTDLHRRVPVFFVSYFFEGNICARFSSKIKPPNSDFSVSVLNLS